MTEEEIINILEEDSEQDISIEEEKVTITSPTSYDQLEDKPKINDVELKGNKTFEDLGAESLTNIEIEEIINSVV